MAHDGQDRRGARTRESSGTMNRFVSLDACGGLSYADAALPQPVALGLPVPTVPDWRPSSTLLSVSLRHMSSTTRSRGAAIPLR